jgi:hypothetical protein
MCSPQVLKDPENKRKVLERTPMRRIGEPHEVSGAPGRQAPAACRITRTVPHVAMAVAWVHGKLVIEWRVSASLLRRCRGVPVLAGGLVCDR